MLLRWCSSGNAGQLVLLRWCCSFAHLVFNSASIWVAFSSKLSHAVYIIFLWDSTRLTTEGIGGHSGMRHESGIGNLALLFDRQRSYTSWPDPRPRPPRRCRRRRRPQEPLPTRTPRRPLAARVLAMRRGARVRPPAHAMQPRHPRASPPKSQSGSPNLGDVTKTPVL